MLETEIMGVRNSKTPEEFYTRILNILSRTCEVRPGKLGMRLLEDKPSVIEVPFLDGKIIACLDCENLDNSIITFDGNIFPEYMEIYTALSELHSLFEVTFQIKRLRTRLSVILDRCGTYSEKE